MYKPIALFALLASLLPVPILAAPTDLADELANDVKRVRIMLAAGEVERAEAQLLVTGARTVAALREQPSDAWIAMHAYSQQSLNNQAAERLRPNQPRRAVEHQLLGADLHELADETGLGLKSFAVLFHHVAIGIAIEGGLGEESLRTAYRLLALHARYPDLDRSRSAGCVALAAIQAAEVGRVAEANILLDELAKTGWEEAAGLIEMARPSLEQRAPGGRP